MRSKGSFRFNWTGGTGPCSCSVHNGHGDILNDGNSACEVREKVHSQVCISYQFNLPLVGASE